uniref:Uncharacterized protein n=2 Tax=Physcomitrium patens TaxID=3218 RepID=A0A2K1LAF4_PHYPA|nr:hypothetical protein PHYPA_001437 [Physcomitrium patens]
MPTKLDIKARKGCTPCGILFLESKDGQNYEENSKDCAPCHLHVDDSIHPQLGIVAISLPCFVCSEKRRIATMFLYNQCQYRRHITYL